MRTRVAVVADSPMFRAGLEAILGADPALEVVGAEPRGDARQVGALVDADVVVRVASTLSSGNRMPDEEAAPVVLLADLAAADAARAVRDGAAAVLPLDADADAVLAAVRSAAAGLVTLPRALLAAFELPAADEPATAAPREGAAAATLTPLTPREREVLALLGQGLPNKAIAPRLGITEHTVKAHVAAIYEKLGAGNRAEAVVAAARAGLLLL